MNSGDIHGADPEKLFRVLDSGRDKPKSVNFKVSLSSAVPPQSVHIPSWKFWELGGRGRPSVWSQMQGTSLIRTEKSWNKLRCLMKLTIVGLQISMQQRVLLIVKMSHSFRNLQSPIDHGWRNRIGKLSIKWKQRPSIAQLQHQARRIYAYSEELYDVFVI